MKSLFIIKIVLFASIAGLLSCKKNRNPKSEYPFIYLNHCINKTYGSDRVQLCFNSVVSDSRCPINAFCIWEGAAIATFTFTNKEAHALTLATDALNLPYAKDTIVEGYKIEFINLQPYPVLNTQPPAPHEIKAEVKITKL